MRRQAAVDAATQRVGALAVEGDLLGVELQRQRRLGIGTGLPLRGHALGLQAPGLQRSGPQ